MVGLFQKVVEANTQISQYSYGPRKLLNECCISVDDPDAVHLSESERLEVPAGCCNNVICDTIFPSGFSFELKKLCKLSIPIVSVPRLKVGAKRLE